MMNSALSVEMNARRGEIAALCVRLGVRRLELFGSATYDDNPGDLDFLVDLGPQAPGDYAAAYFDLKDRLHEIFRKPIDLVTEAGLSNPYFRQGVERDKQLLYAA